MVDELPMNATNVGSVVERITFPAAGECIYCGRRAGRLSDEHIIPANLGGTAILKESSCGECATITGRLEQYCLRGMFQDARVQLGLRQRRKAKGPIMMPTRAMVGGQEVVFDLPIDSHPTMLFLPYFSEPQIMAGASVVDPKHKMKIWHKRLNFDLAALKERQVQSVYSSALDTWRFGRMLAKVGHSFAVAQTGLKAFRPLLPSLILDDNNPPPFLYVGGTYEQQQPGPGVHQLCFGTATYARRTYVAVRIQLFALLAAPAYHVIVGEV